MDRRKGKRFKKENKIEVQSSEKEETAENKLKRKKRILKQLKMDAVVKPLFIVIIFVFMFTFIIGIAQVERDDMSPNVKPGDVVFYFRMAEPINSDAVVYEDGSGNKIIGRIQGMPGEKIGRTEGGLLTISGNIQPVQKQAGLFYETKISKDNNLSLPSTVPEGHYLILGDNRDDAKDSRELGYINKNNVKGKIFTVIRRRVI